MKAVIMAGGEGTRLRPLTSRTPKPMLPLVNKPMMEHIIELLRKHGITEVVVTVSYFANAIRNYFGDGSEFGVEMVYATEEAPMGTAGSVRNAREELTETFLVISGDVLTDINLTDLIAGHRESGAKATLGLKSMENPVEFGIVIRDGAGNVQRFLEKPTWGQVFSDTVNTGIYVLEPEIFPFIPEGEKADFSGEVFPAMIEAGEAIHGHVVEGYWEDVGTLSSYLRAHFDALDGKVQIDVPGFRMENGVWLGEGSEVDPDAVLEGPVVIGPYSTVEAGTRIGEHTVLGSNVRVGAEADLQRCIVHDNSYLGSSVRLRATVLGRSVDLRRGVRCEEGVVVGDETFVGDHAILSTGVKVYPHKVVEHGAIVNSSIVWESRAARHLFSQLGIAGLANVDITPELATRVAMAFASTLDKGATVSMSRDSSRSARAMSRAMHAGLNASGINVLDLEVAPVPVTRFQVRSQRAHAGITVRLASDDPQSVVIRFFNSQGYDIDEVRQRKVERAYYREDFRRVPASEIGDMAFPSRAIEHYTEALIQTLPIEEIRARKFKVVLDYSYGASSFVMPNVLSKLDAEVLAVNPFGSTQGMLRFDRREHAARVGALVQASGAHVGVVFGPDGERLTLVDDLGHVLTDVEASLAILSLVGQTAGVARQMVAPISLPRAGVRLAEQYGLQLIWAQQSLADLMMRCGDRNVALGIGSEGGFVFRSFLPSYDAICAFGNVVGMLAQTGHRLSDVVASLPRVHVAHETIATPWEEKGHLMRALVEASSEKELVLVEGLKIVEDEAWTLVLPDPEKPLTHVWAEATSSREARGRAQAAIRQIREILRSDESNSTPSVET